MTLPLQVGNEGACTVPPTNCNHPVLMRSWGVMLKSPARIHGPRSSPITPAIAWSRSMFRQERPSPKKRYTLMRCTPPRHKVPTQRTMILEVSMSQGGVYGERAMPKCARAAIATPALVLPATVLMAGPIVKDQPSRAAERSFWGQFAVRTRISWNRQASAPVRSKYDCAATAQFPFRQSNAQRPASLKLRSPTRVSQAAACAAAFS